MCLNWLHFQSAAHWLEVGCALLNRGGSDGDVAEARGGSGRPDA